MRMSDWSSDVCSSDLYSRVRRRYLSVSPERFCEHLHLTLAPCDLTPIQFPLTADAGECVKICLIREGRRCFGIGLSDDFSQRGGPQPQTDCLADLPRSGGIHGRSEEHTSELQSLMRI